jgi:hypothetical protein
MDLTGEREGQGFSIEETLGVCAERIESIERTEVVTDETGEMERSLLVDQETIWGAMT